MTQHTAAHNQQDPLSQTNLSCTHCSYNLAGLDLAGSCPECGTKIITNCYKCDYNLDGLDPSGSCPECGYLIADSVGRGILSRCDPAYLERLHKGVVLVQTAIILMIAYAISIGIIGTVATRITNIDPILFELIVTTLSLALSFMFLIGWYKFSTPNEQVGESYSGRNRRKFVRWMVILTALFKLAQLPLAFFNYSAVVLTIGGILAIASVVLFAVRFYAEMLYVRWMAPLLRNNRVYKRTTTLMWMGPIMIGGTIVTAFMSVFISPMLAAFGMIFVAIGLLAMLIMYWNMLDWIRKDLKAIRAAFED
ncbi:MAG: hypothetical protein ACSHX5_06860 [Phycisphaerales bacterium]